MYNLVAVYLKNVQTNFNEIKEKIEIVKKITHFFFFFQLKILLCSGKLNISIQFSDHLNKNHNPKSFFSTFFKTRQISQKHAS